MNDIERQAVKDAHQDLVNLSQNYIFNEKIIIILYKIFSEGKYWNEMIDCICFHDNKFLVNEINRNLNKFEDVYDDVCRIFDESLDMWMKKSLEYDSINMLNLLNCRHVKHWRNQQGESEKSMREFDAHLQHLKMRKVCVEMFSLIS